MPMHWNVLYGKEVFSLCKIFRKHLIYYVHNFFNRDKRDRRQLFRLCGWVGSDDFSASFCVNLHIFTIRHSFKLRCLPYLHFSSNFLLDH